MRTLNSSARRARGVTFRHRCLFCVPLPRRANLMARCLGLIVTSDMTLASWVPPILEALRTRLRDKPVTSEKVLREAERLFRFLAASGIFRWPDVTPESVEAWFWAARRYRYGRHRRTADSTARNRRWVARLIFEEAASLGAPIDPTALIGERIPRPTDFVSARPLTDTEAELSRVFSDPGLVATRRSVIVAVSYAGATATEASNVRLADIDLQAGTVAFSGPAARIGPLDAWGVETVDRFLRNNPPVADDDVLCVKPSTDPARAAHSVTVRLGHVLKDAGLAGRAGVTARSIRLTTARRILETEGIEAAARFLGSPSLDNTARALHHNWRGCGHV